VSDVKRILDAMVALVKALPGADKARFTIGIHGCSETALRAFVAEGAEYRTYSNGEHEWNAAEMYLDEGTLAGYGDHRPVAKPTDAAAVEAALAKAEEVLGERCNTDCLREGPA